MKMEDNIFPFYYSAFYKYDFIYFVKMLNYVLSKQNIMSDKNRRMQGGNEMVISTVL